MSDRGATITDPSLNAAFAEGVQQGLRDAYSGDEPEWDVTVAFEGTTLNKYRTTSAEKVLLETRHAVTNGCDITIAVVRKAEHGIAAAITEANDAEVVDAEIVD